MSAMRTHALPWLWSSSGSTSSPTAAIRKKTMFLPFFMASSSGTVRHTLAEQAGRPQREHDDQHDESEDVAVVASEHVTRERPDIARPDGFDEPQQDAPD